MSVGIADNFHLFYKRIKFVASRAKGRVWWPRWTNQIYILEIEIAKTKTLEPPVVPFYQFRSNFSSCKSNKNGTDTTQKLFPGNSLNNL